MKIVKIKIHRETNENSKKKEISKNKEIVKIKGSTIVRLIFEFRLVGENRKEKFKYDLY